jgi:hypothetical protein
LLNDASDIDDDVINLALVLGLANLLKLTSNEIHLGLLHTNIKLSARIPLNPRFKAVL